jgi:hypothetical protein
VYLAARRDVDLHGTALEVSGAASTNHGRKLAGENLAEHDAAPT